jgi:hypothetical protein
VAGDYPGKLGNQSSLEIAHPVTPVHRKAYRSSCKVLLLSDFYHNWNVSTNISDTTQ